MVRGRASHSRVTELSGPGHRPSPLWLYPFCSKAGHQQDLKLCHLSTVVHGRELAMPLHAAHASSHARSLVPSLPPSQQLPEAPKLNLSYLYSFSGVRQPQVSSLPHCPSIGLYVGLYRAYIQVVTIYTHALPKLVPILYPSSETLHSSHCRLLSAKWAQGFIKVFPYHTLPPPTTSPPCPTRQLREPPNLTSLKVIPDPSPSKVLKPSTCIQQIQPKPSLSSSDFLNRHKLLSQQSKSDPILSHHEMSPQPGPSIGFLPNSTQKSEYSSNNSKN